MRADKADMTPNSIIPTTTAPQPLTIPVATNAGAVSFMALVAPTLTPGVSNGASATPPAVTIANPSMPPALAQKGTAQSTPALLVSSPVSGSAIEGINIKTKPMAESAALTQEAAPVAAEALPDIIAPVATTPKPLTLTAAASGQKEARTSPEKIDTSDSLDAPVNPAPLLSAPDTTIKASVSAKTEMSDVVKDTASQDISQDTLTQTSAIDDVPDNARLEAEPAQAPILTDPAKAEPVIAAVNARQAAPTDIKQSNESKPRNSAPPLNASPLSHQSATQEAVPQTLAAQTADTHRVMTQAMAATPQATRIAETGNIPQASTSAAPAQQKSSDPLAMITLPDIVSDNSASQSLAPTKAIPAQPGRFGEELAVAIARHTQQGTDARSETLMLRLDPPEHGRIEIKLIFEDGAPLRASLLTSNPATLDMLRRDSADLFRALGQAGVSADAQSFQFESRTPNGGQGQQHSSASSRFNQPGSFNDSEAQALLDASEATPDYRRLRNNSAINLIT